MIMILLQKDLHLIDDLLWLFAGAVASTRASRSYCAKTGSCSFHCDYQLHRLPQVTAPTSVFVALRNFLQVD